MKELIEIDSHAELPQCVKEEFERVKDRFLRELQMPGVETNVNLFQWDSPQSCLSHFYYVMRDAGIDSTQFEKYERGAFQDKMLDVYMALMIPQVLLTDGIARTAVVSCMLYSILNGYTYMFKKPLLEYCNAVKKEVSRGRINVEKVMKTYLEYVVRVDFELPTQRNPLVEYLSRAFSTGGMDAVANAVVKLVGVAPNTLKESPNTVLMETAGILLKQ